MPIVCLRSKEKVGHIRERKVGGKRTREKNNKESKIHRKIRIIERGVPQACSRTCVKRNAVFGARVKGLSLYFRYQEGNLIRIQPGLDTYLIRIQFEPPCHGTPLMIIRKIGKFPRTPSTPTLRDFLTLETTTATKQHKFSCSVGSDL